MCLRVQLVLRLRMTIPVVPFADNYSKKKRIANKKKPPPERELVTVLTAILAYFGWG